MANRTDGTEVKTIITTIKTISEVENYITAANLIVTEKLTGSGLSTAHMKEIETWLSAHFVAVDDRSAAIQEEEIDGAANKYEGKTGVGLESTRYGQQVKLLDTTGLLNSIGKAAAEVKAII